MRVASLDYGSKGMHSESKTLDDIRELHRSFESRNHCCSVPSARGGLSRSAWWKLLRQRARRLSKARVRLLSLVGLQAVNRRQT